MSSTTESRAPDGPLDERPPHAAAHGRWVVVTKVQVTFIRAGSFAGCPHHYYAGARTITFQNVVHEKVQFWLVSLILIGPSMGKKAAPPGVDHLIPEFSLGIRYRDPSAIRSSGAET